MLTIHAFLFGFIVNFLKLVRSIEGPVTENGVYVLNKDNFSPFINAHEVVLVEFYAPWCGHCKTFAPIYSDAALELSKNIPPIPLAKVDATVETELANKYDVNGYPTLKYFKSGQYYDFEADRSAKGIVTFLKYVNSPNWKPPKNHVITLTKENFTDVVQRSEYILIEFFAPWCGHCKTLAPEFAKAAKELSKEDPPISLAVVDATQETDLATEFGITGYPTLKLYRNGKMRDYNGPRYSDGIVDWMIKNRANAAKKINSNSELTKLRDSEKVMVLGLFKSEEDKLYTTFIDSSNRVRDEIIGAFSFNEDLRKFYKEEDNENIGSVLLLKADYFLNKYEPHYVKYIVNDTSVTSVDSMVHFFESSMLPILGEYNHNTSPFYKRFQKDYLCIFFFTVDFTVHHRSATKMWLEKLIEIAVKYQDKIKFAVADDEKQFEKLKELRIDDSGEDMNLGCTTREDVKFRMPPMDEFDRDHIYHFIEDMLEGKVFPLLKSAPIPRLTASVVKPVVGDSYKNLINDASSDGIILLYRSPSDTFENLRNVLVNLSSKLTDKSLLLFSMDLSANDLPPISGLEMVDSRPTLYFIAPANNDSSALLKKRLIKFGGDHLTESDILSFIAKNREVLKEEL